MSAAKPSGTPRSASASANGTTKITRDDLEAKFRELKEDVEETTETAKSYAMAAAVVVGLVIFVVAFGAGRKRGKKKSTVVEIRRI